MKKSIFFVLAICLVFTSFGQNKQDQVNKIADEISASLKKLGIVLSEETKQSVGFENKTVVAYESDNTFYSYKEDKNGYTFKNQGLFISGGLNSKMKSTPSPIVFGRLASGGEINSLTVGYSFAYKTKADNLYNWWGFNSLSRETSVYMIKFLTNEYQISLKGDYNWGFAEDYINFGGNFDGGFYSVSPDSLLKPYVYFGGNASLFYLYGSIGMIYSPYIKYKSLYVFMNDFIPIYELGVKTPNFRIKDFYLVSSVTYVDFGLYNPKVYVYDSNGQIVEDISKRIDKDFFRTCITLSDFYGNVFEIGATTNDWKKIQFGASVKISLNNIGKYF